MKKTKDETGFPWLVARRGAMDEAPENTRSAFDAALAHRIDGLELDVQMTRDSALVLYHDHDVKKICGRRESIGERDYKDLRHLDWGNTPHDPLDDSGLAHHLFAYSASIARLEPSITKHWHDSGKTVMTWTCNTPDAVDRAHALGCDVIMTDRPGWIVEYLQPGNSGR